MKGYRTMAKQFNGTEIVGKLRQAVETACAELGVSQRKAGQTLDQSRSSQRYELRLPVKDASLIEAIKKQSNFPSGRDLGIGGLRSS